jgi:glycosyltransferase involved in cell wall biosynthesis
LERVFRKYDYAILVRSSLCVLTTTYQETFGCVFSESYYLGTPVIADIRSGAVKEIIDNNYIVNYDNPSEIYSKIKKLQIIRNNLIIELEEKFLFENNFKKWLKLL